jgi:hypothetical protein
MCADCLTDPSPTLSMDVARTGPQQAARACVGKHSTTDLQELPPAEIISSHMQH